MWLVGKVLAKIQRDKARVLLIAPKWPQARWWGLLQSLVVDSEDLSMNDSTITVGQGQDPRKWPGATAIAALVDPRKRPLT